MASPLVCLFVTFGESHSRMMIDWATGDTSGEGVAGSQQGKELSVRLLRIILAISSVPAQFPIEVYILSYYYNSRNKSSHDLKFKIKIEFDCYLI